LAQSVAIATEVIEYMIADECELSVNKRLRFSEDFSSGDFIGQENKKVSGIIKKNHLGIKGELSQNSSY